VRGLTSAREGFDDDHAAAAAGAWALQYALLIGRRVPAHGAVGLPAGSAAYCEGANGGGPGARLGAGRLKLFRNKSNN
jgi:hypothetical protein